MKVVIVIGLPLLLMILGTVGYHHVEGWTWEESFYMTVITISTVGYSELQDMTEAGRMFSVLLILVSFGSLSFQEMQVRTPFWKKPAARRLVG